ncbi:agmatine deiminase family protein [Parvicella tangerina]|uniref:Peptidylarginine deiminase n=1 Tax=Parvicella tangerina TaxID=2829795 RepID=A0A916JKQ5_9FLAO|nr:agmatine deiminase family protein [Parvicella tangerina]CAG5077357.1 Peptidylarginine deiminase [Parvicella tangerina]
MKKLTVLSLLLTTFSFAQQNLPVGFASSELSAPQWMYNQGGSSRGLTSPPTLPIRTAGEWEEVQTLLITWTSYPSIHAQIVDAAQEECEVLISCSDSNAVKSYLTNSGVPLTNIDYLEVDYNTIWQRDYSAHTAYLNDVDSLVLVEWIYNRPRPDDDAMPTEQANHKGITLYSTTQAPNDLVNTGGNWMVDGFGTAFASSLILEENEAGNPYGVTTKTEAEIDTIVKKFHGIERYIKMDALPYDGINHIDMHMKLLDEERLLIGEFPDGISDGPQIEANIQYVLSNFNSVYGTPYEVTRIPMPPSTGGDYPGWPYGNGSYRTYTNCVFINGTVIVPTYREEYDTTALRILEESLPGYNIVPIDCDNSGANIISQSGAIHCITNTIGVAEPLLIRHQNLPDTYVTNSPYQVDALIKHKSGISSATLYYSTDLSGVFFSVPMTATGNDMWTADLPQQPAGTTVYYYIEGNANSGKTQVRPIVAPDGYFHFKVLDNGSVGVNENAFELQDVFPNPASAITCIPVFSNGEVSATIKMYDLTGNLVETIFSGSLPMGESKYFIHANEYAAGAYMIEVESKGNKQVQRLMIR